MEITNISFNLIDKLSAESESAAQMIGGLQGILKFETWAQKKPHAEEVIDKFFNRLLELHIKEK